MATATQPEKKEQPKPSQLQPKSTPPEAVLESKASKFVRLCNRRMTAALKVISNIGNLSNRSGYEYTPEQVSKLTTALRAAVTDIEGRFRSGEKSKTGFTL